jgi:hypothetical protein
MWFHLPQKDIPTCILLHHCQDQICLIPYYLTCIVSESITGEGKQEVSTAAAFVGAY